MLMGLGKEPQRVLFETFSGSLPPNCTNPEVFLPGTLVVQGVPYDAEPELAARIAEWEGLADWPVVLVVDNTNEATLNLQEFLWTFFTRFEPAADIHGAKSSVVRFHVGLQEPIVFDCRMKPWYPEVLEVDPATKQKVDDKMHDLLPPKWR